MLPTSTNPTATTPLSGRRWPNVAYDANIEVPHTRSPMIRMWWRYWMVERLAADREVGPGPDHGRWPSPRTGRASEAPSGNAMQRRHQRQEERGEDRPDQEGQPAAPADLGPDERRRGRHRRRRAAGSRGTSPTEDPARVVDGPGHRQADEDDEAEGQPALGGASGMLAGSSGEDLAERLGRA